MPVTVDGVRLWQAEESSAATQAQLDVTTPPGYESGDNLIVGLKSQGTMSVSGLATGIRLTQQSGYPSDPEDALAQWLLEFESLCNASQGEGYTVEDDERVREVNAVVEDLSWTRNQGAPYQVRWGISLRQGEGTMAASSRTPESATPQSSTTLGGHDLGSVVEKRTEVAIDVGSIPLAYADESETVLVPNGGVTKQITISGRVGGDQSTLRTTDDQFETWVGEDQTRTYQTGFPGTAHEVRIANYDSTYRAGSPSILEYNLSLLEGITLS